jgi:hypothetical protein
LKAPFLHGYLCTLVERMNSRKDTSINVKHCETYYEFNIKKVEFGNESVWMGLQPKNGRSGNTVKRSNFVLSFDVTDSDQGIEMVKDTIEFLAFTIEKREKDPVVVSCWIILNIMQMVSTDTIDHHPSVKSAEESLNNDVSAQFRGGFTINTHACLNRFMVDYDIIRVLKSHV